MKGVVFTEFFEMVEAAFSADVVDDLIESTKPESGGAYTAVGTYDHGEIVAMVVELSRRSGMSVPQLLETFGTYLFGRFVEMYPRFFDGQEDSLSFLASIESVIHVEVKKLYPDAELPRFDIERHDRDHMTMIYSSPRGMSDLAAGLMAGCFQHFGDCVDVVQHVEGPTSTRFELTRRDARG